MWNSPRAFPHIPLSLSLGISHQNLLSFQCSYIIVATVCSQRTLFHYLISQQQLAAQKIPAARNYHSSCFLLFRNPWVLPVSKPLSPASHQYGLENGFFNPATGPITPTTPHHTSLEVILGPSFSIIPHTCSPTKFCPISPILQAHPWSLRKMWVHIFWLCHCSWGCCCYLIEEQVVQAMAAQLQKPTPRPVTVSFEDKECLQVKTKTKEELTWKICELYFPQIFLSETSSNVGLSKAFFLNCNCLATDPSEGK